MSGYDDGSDAPATDERARTTGTATSRLKSGRMGVRKATKARLAISAPSGAGKTWTALSTAFILAPGGRVLGIDTEPGDDRQGAMELYADAFPPFDIIQWEPPYDPRDLTITIRDAGIATVPDGHWPGERGYDVIIVDSASPFWKGEGGTMDIAGGKFGGWKTASPAQDQLVNAILRTPAHIIVCTRAKQAYEVTEVMEGNAKKQKVEKLGLQPIQRDDLEYEFQVVCVMDEAHRIDIGKTRAAPLAGLSFQANDQHKFAEIYRDWLASGADPARAIDVAALKHAILSIPDPAEQAKTRTEFKAEFGDPNMMEGKTVPVAWEWIAERRNVDLHPMMVGDLPGLCATCGMADRAPWHVGDPVPVDKPADPDAQDPATDSGVQEPTEGDGSSPDGHTDGNQGTVAAGTDDDPGLAGAGFESLEQIAAHVKAMGRATLASELTAAGVKVEDPKTAKLDDMRLTLASIIAKACGLAEEQLAGEPTGDGTLGV